MFSLNVFLHFLLPLSTVAFFWSAASYRAFRQYPFDAEAPNRRIREPLCTTLFGSKDESGQEIEGFSAELVRSLDLYPIFSAIAAHTGTRRGYRVVMSYVGDNDDVLRPTLSGNSPLNSMRRRASGYDFANVIKQRRAAQCMPVAKSVQEARKLYELTAEAILALTRDNGLNLTHPPMYGDDSGPFDTNSVPLTDYDEWLYFSSVEEWTLEHILQAEKVIQTLLQVHKWSEQVHPWIPQIAAMGLEIDAVALQRVWEETRGSVEVARVRSITDPSGRSSYVFRINREKYPVVGILEDKLNEYRSRSSVSENKIRDMTTEIEARENEIKDGLVRVVCSQLYAIEQGLEKMGQIDSSFAKAAFSQVSGGQIPSMDTNGCINVKQFMHPLLMQRMEHSSTVVPTDLQMNDSKRILICSGANGGGKTVAMKAFGIASVFSKTGVPIPISRHEQERPRVDFFDEIHVSIGDGQDPENGQSTFTAQLSKYSSILARVLSESNGEDISEGTSSKSSSHLIIMDELGTGTEASAGGAIAEAILEKLSSTSSCRVVATTHSKRLKSLSFESDNYECAAVLLKTNEGQGSKFHLPAFQLQYGIIGESYALGAASRCSPPLPVDVLERAEKLLTQEVGSDLDASHYHAMNRSLQKQLQLAEEARAQAEKCCKDMEQIRRSMLALASSYDEHFGRLESRLDSCFNELSQTQKGSSLELVGETIAQLRVVRKQVKSENDRLKERGIKILPSNYVPADGEMVVIIQQGDLDGMQASVVSSINNELSPDEILVLPSSFGDLSGDLAGVVVEPRPTVFKRHEIGIWDYESIWDEKDNVKDTNSIPESRRRLADILSRVKAKGGRSDRPLGKSGEKTSSFNSSRERKAAKKASGGKKRKP